MTETKFFPLTGGMDVVTPSITVSPGRTVSGRNYESAPRGYRRIDGWERYDGRTKPSEALYTVIEISSGALLPSVGVTVTGASSGKTAKVIYAPTIHSGTVAAGDAVMSMPVVDNTGLLNGELLRVGAVNVGIISAEPNSSGPGTLEEEKNWSIATRNEFRSRIGIVPGSGPVRGVWTYKGDVYAFRDNAGATACIMHKASPTGWQPITFGSSIAFDGGTVALIVGNTVTGGTSGATATIKKVVLQDGDWTTNNGEGRIIVTGVTGTFQNDELITTAPTGSARVNGTLSAVTLPPGGRYHFDNHNFTATTGALYMYGVNGVGYGFEFDGVNLTPIITGEPDDRPIRVAAHNGHLFFGYINGRLIHSSLFKPLNFEIVSGSLLTGIGEEITDICPTATGELAIFGQNKVTVLYGKNSTNWNLVTLTNESGSIPWTAQLIGAPLYLDNIGVRSLDSTQSYGNFALGTKTQLIQTHVTTKLKGGITAVGSLRIRKKDTYRLFWSDGSGIAIYFGRRQPECMLFDLGFAPSCTCSGEDISGREILFIGTSTGYVMEMDSGPSADGDDILAYIRLPFNHVGSPAFNKRWHKAVVEVDAAPQTKISVVYSLSYADTSLPQPSETEFEMHGGGGFWNEALWNSFYWSSPVEGTAHVRLAGIGNNLSLVVISEDGYSAPHSVHGVSLYYSYRRMLR